MGHRAEKQAYGSTKAFKRSGDPKPGWKAPKIGVTVDGKQKWQPRHRKDS